MVVEGAQAEAEPEIFVPTEWDDHFVRTEEKFCREIRRIDPSTLIPLFVSNCKSGYQYIKPYLDRYQHPKILEMGSGYGFDLCYLRKLGLDAHGIEPGSSFGFEGRYDQALALLKANGCDKADEILFQAVGESLPFADKSFDIVYSVSVLEHVRDVEKCLLEALRVVKPGGVVLMSVPNYDSFREDHYDIVWLPYLLRSKRVAKWYVRNLFKRADWFVDELNFTSPAYFKRLGKGTSWFKQMKMFPTMYPNFGDTLARVGQTYYHMCNFPADRMQFKHRALRWGSGLASTLLSVLGIATGFRIVWEVPAEVSSETGCSRSTGPGTPSHP